MRDQYDAVIIGAGVIGAATAYELGKRGYRTLSVDKNPAAGYGPTSNSCAIIRVYYSTFDGTAFAWEAYHFWKNWAEYLATGDERGLAKFIDCGCLVMKTEHNGHLEKHVRLSKELGISCEEWDRATIREKLPFYDLRSYGPPRAPDDERFGGRAGASSRAGSSGPPAATSPIRSSPPTTFSVRRNPKARSSCSVARSWRSVPARGASAASP